MEANPLQSIPFLGVILLALVVLCVMMYSQYKTMRPLAESRVYVKLRRFLHYRDKAKALDRYMRGDIKLHDLRSRYQRIMKKHNENK